MVHTLHPYAARAMNLLVGPYNSYQPTLRLVGYISAFQDADGAPTHQVDRRPLSTLQDINTGLEGGEE